MKLNAGECRWIQINADEFNSMERNLKLLRSIKIIAYKCGLISMKEYVYIVKQVHAYDNQSWKKKYEHMINVCVKL